jgi:nicotinamide-nucleotide adenylyltransferase
MRGFFPGRFQPFHEGHYAFVEQIAAEVDEVVVGIGSAQASHTGRNPFTAGERVSMIHGALSALDATTYVIPIEDVDRYALWPTHVQALSPRFEAVYTNNPLVARVCREADLDVRAVDPIERDRYRGTTIRRRMVDGEPWRDRVPDATVEVVEAVEGLERLREVVEHDREAVGSRDAG